MIHDRTPLSITYFMSRFSHADVVVLPLVALVTLSVMWTLGAYLATAVFAAGDAFCAPSLTRPARAYVASRRSAPAAAVRLDNNDIEEPPVFESIEDLEGEGLRLSSIFDVL